MALTDDSSSRSAGTVCPERWSQAPGTPRINPCRSTSTSTAHVLAQAVQQIFPETKLGIGPPITDGFYYDFDSANPFTPDHLVKLESAMKKIIKEGQRFRRRVVSANEALSELKNEPYKYEWGAVDEPIQRLLVRGVVA